MLPGSFTASFCVSFSPFFCLFFWGGGTIPRTKIDDFWRRADAENGVRFQPRMLRMLRILRMFGMFRVVRVGVFFLLLLSSVLLLLLLLLFFLAGVADGDADVERDVPKRKLLATPTPTSTPSGRPASRNRSDVADVDVAAPARLVLFCVVWIFLVSCRFFFSFFFGFYFVCGQEFASFFLTKGAGRGGSCGRGLGPWNRSAARPLAGGDVSAPPAANQRSRHRCGHPNARKKNTNITKQEIDRRPNNERRRASFFCRRRRRLRFCLCLLDFFVPFCWFVVCVCVCVC